MWELEKQFLFAISQGPWRRNGFAERSVRFFTKKLNSLYFFFPMRDSLVSRGAAYFPNCVGAGFGRDKKAWYQIAWGRGSVVARIRGT